jgi:hypothetical protein
MLRSEAFEVLAIVVDLEVLLLRSHERFLVVGIAESESSQNLRL